MRVAASLALVAAPGLFGGGIGMLPLLLFIPLMYFLMIRPQQKRQKQWQDMLKSLKTGDRVTTAGGIRGIILSIKEDVIIIREECDCIGDHAGQRHGILVLPVGGSYS
jgi:preprotein translocase subunit YajC